MKFLTMVCALICAMACGIESQQDEAAQADSSAMAPEQSV